MKNNMKNIVGYKRYYFTTVQPLKAKSGKYALAP